MLIRVLIALTAAVCFSNSDGLKYNLFEFVDFVSSSNKVDIIVSDDINASKFTFFSKNNELNVSLPVFSSMLSKKGLILRKFGSVYFVSPKNDDIDFISRSRLRHFKFDNFLKDETLKLLNLLDLNGTYIDASNSLYFSNVDDDLFSDLQKSFEFLDQKPEQLSLKLTIFETDLDKIKKRGASINSYLKSKSDASFNYYVNLITMPFNATSNVSSASRQSFYSVLNYLNGENFTQIKSSPIILMRSGKSVFFSSVFKCPLFGNK